MKVLVFGAAGTLGHKLVQRLGERFDVYGTLRKGFDSVQRFHIFDPGKIIENVDAIDTRSLEAAILAVNPDVVINAIGIVKQVPTAKDIVTTLEINSILPHRLAVLGKKYNFRLISVSTDCVFDGARGNLNEKDVPNAADLYGKSKYLGGATDENCLTIRSSIIGRELATAHGLLEWFLSNRGLTVSGYTTAIYSGFPTIIFADIIENLITYHPGLSGLYHIASEPISKYDMLGLINRYYDAAIKLEPSNDLKIDRSLDGGKFNNATGFQPKPWDEMVRLMAADATPYGSFKR